MKEPLLQTHHTIGIAGHIDHGKTTLTRMLTGVETDRLKEEKERNISIELGFAPCKLPNGQTIGIVDVPGHERFIRQMIAGAAGIDLVVLVVAADEGIMPQTREHADILGYMGIEKGVIALTKTDLVDEEWLSLIKEEIKAWAQDTFLADAPLISVSGKTGAGKHDLLQTITTQLQDVPHRRVHAPFRLPIDRSFTIKGAGTVVTGTVYEGLVEEGDTLELLPAQQEVRVRRVQVHHQGAERASAGQRTALNLTGIERDEVTRGMTLAAPGYFQSTERLDIRFHLLKHLGFSLKQRTMVRLHIGTSEVEGTLILFDRNTLQGGDEVLAQLHLKERITVKKGDPFILRRPTPAITLGGGQVLEPYAERHPFGEETIKKLQLLNQEDPQERLLRFLEEREFSTVEEMQQHLAMGSYEIHAVVAQLLKTGEILSLNGEVSRQEGGYVLTTAGLTRWLEGLQIELKKYHSTFPLRIGMSKAALKSLRYKGMPDRLWRQFLKEAEKRSIIIEEGDSLRLLDFTSHPPDKYRDVCRIIEERLTRSALTPESWGALIKESGLPEQEAGDFKAYLLQKREIIHLAKDFYIIRKEWEKGIAKLRQYSGTQELITPAAAKEALDLSRKYLIPFLESLDRENLTQRVEEGRIWKQGK